VLDADGTFSRRCNREMVDLEALIDADEIDFVQTLIMRHVAVTGSTYAKGLLDDWAGLQGRLVKVMPREYKRALAEMAKQKAAESRVAEPVAAKVSARAAASPAHG
jgi:glutamate synthase (ferredoxin)